MSILRNSAPSPARGERRPTALCPAVTRVLLALSLAPLMAASAAVWAQDRQMAPALGASQGTGAGSSEPELPAPPALSGDILIGKWCGDTTNYIFTARDLTVEFHSGGTRVLKIDHIRTGDTWIDVHWVGKRQDGGSNNTVFADFSPDRTVMHQAANVGGDKGPRRLFRRCSAPVGWLWQRLPAVRSRDGEIARG